MARELQGGALKLQKVIGTVERFTLMNLRSFKFIIVNKGALGSISHDLEFDRFYLQYIDIFINGSDILRSSNIYLRYLMY